MNYQNLRRIVPVIALTLAAIAAPAFSQQKRVEINPFFGYTFSDGVTVDPITIGGQIYNEVNPKSGMAFGIGFGVYVNENMEVGFLWARQDSVLEGKGTDTREFSDMNVNNYHGIFTYNFGEEDANARPFVFGGLGATSYSPSEDISGETRFSSTWGGGVKAYVSPNVGVSVMARLTPTYIKSDPAGYWCGFYGCYVIADTQYSNQFEISGGLSLRF